jgi:hypothetical protein
MSKSEMCLSILHMDQTIEISQIVIAFKVCNITLMCKDYWISITITNELITCKNYRLSRLMPYRVSHQIRL